MKFEVNPTSEYDSLRQELLKRIEIHFMILNINLTSAGVLLGFGIENNLIAMILPPIVLFLVVTLKNNTVGYMKIGDYLQKNYTVSNHKLNWESYNAILESTKSMRLRRSLLGIGSLGVFITSPLIAITIGILAYKGLMIEKFLITIDVISICGILLLFALYSTRKIRKHISVGSDEILKIKPD